MTNVYVRWPDATPEQKLRQAKYIGRDMVRGIGLWALEDYQFAAKKLVDILDPEWLAKQKGTDR